MIRNMAERVLRHLSQIRIGSFRGGVRWCLKRVPRKKARKIHEPSASTRSLSKIRSSTAGTARREGMAGHEWAGWIRVRHLGRSDYPRFSRVFDRRAFDSVGPRDDAERFGGKGRKC